MRKSIAYPGLALLALLAVAAISAERPVEVTAHPEPLRALASPDAMLAAHKRLVFDLWREVVEAGREQRTAQFVGAGFIDHDPNAASGLEGISRYFATRADRSVEPWIRAPVVAIVAEADLVALVTMREHPHPVHAGRTYTTTWFDLFRIEDGRVVEHWNSAAPADPSTGSGW